MLLTKYSTHKSDNMQLKPEYESAFENVFSMSGMPEQHFGFNDSNQQNSINTSDDDAAAFEGMRAYLGCEEKSNSLKRGPDDNPDSGKRSKSSGDFGGFQQGGMSQFSQGMGMGLGMNMNMGMGMGAEGNIFVSLYPSV